MIKLNGEQLRQYDLNRTVELIPKHGHTVESVCFYKGQNPLTVAHREEDGKIIADIPNSLLKGFGNLTVKVHLTDKDGFYTNENQVFWIDNREKPEEYSYEETPVLTLGSGGKGGGVSSWDELGKKVANGVIKYDGDMSKYETGKWQGADILKMSDKTFTKAELVGSTCAVWQDLGAGLVKTEYVLTEDDVTEVPLDESGTIAAYMVIVNQVGVAISIVMDLSSMGLPIGTYFFDTMSFGDSDAYYCESLSCITGEVETITPIPEEYLPGPTLLGEITLTGENTTLNEENDSCRDYNDELKAAVADLFDKIKNTEGIAMAKVTLGGIVVTHVVCSCFGDLPLSGMVDYIIIGTGTLSVTLEECCIVGDPYFMTLINQNSMTIKVYAV